MQAPLIVRFQIDLVNHQRVTGHSVSDAAHSEYRRCKRSTGLSLRRHKLHQSFIGLSRKFNGWVVWLGGHATRFEVDIRAAIAVDGELIPNDLAMQLKIGATIIGDV